MAHWALVIFLFGGQYNTTPAIGSVAGFDSQARCEAAAAQMRSRDHYCVQTDESDVAVGQSR